MKKIPDVSFNQLLVGGCLFVILVVLPGVLLYWNSHPTALQLFGEKERGVADSITGQRIVAPDDVGPAPLTAGTDAPHFSGTTVTGKPYVFDPKSPHIKVVDFWATWCPPCRMSIPAIEDLDESLKNQGVEVIGYSVDTDTANRVGPFAKARNMNYTVLVDPEKSAQAQIAYDTYSLPAVYIIDGKGIIRWSFCGYWPDEELYIRQIIDDIQSGRPASQQ